MALTGTENNGHNNGGNNNGQNGQPPRPTTMGDAFEKATTTAQPQPGRTFSFRDLGRLGNAPMGRTPAAEVLTKLQKALAAVYENVNKAYEVTLIPIDESQNADLVVSVLVVCAREVAQKDLGVAYHVLVLEGSIEAIPSRWENINGQNVEIIRTVADALIDARMANVVRDAVAKVYPHTKLYNADATVVPRDFKLDDDDLVYALSQNTIYAASFELEQRRPDFVDMNLANASRDETLLAKIAFPRTEFVNPVGMPVRSDIQIDLTAVPVASQQGAQLVESSTLVTRVGGFLDLVYDSVMAPSNPYGLMTTPQQVQNQYQRYATRFVVTTLDNLKLPTLPGQLMAMVTALALRENNAWVQAFRPSTFAGDEVDLHDIGAIGIEANFQQNPSGFGEIIDTKSANFKPENLTQLVTAVIKPGLILSLDVAEAGPDTAWNGVFAAAATGNVKANEAIVRAANELTNGHFARHFQQNGQVCIDEGNRIHLGYYFDRQGVKRDLRQIDYLAILNLFGQKDPEVVRDWSDSFNRTNFPLVQRLAGRRRIIQGIFTDAVITGFARRVTFLPAFLDALALACQECGLDVRSVTPYADAGTYERANAQFASQTLMSANATGIFNRGMGTSFRGANTGADRTFGGRWYS